MDQCQTLVSSLSFTHCTRPQASTTGLNLVRANLLEHVRAPKFESLKGTRFANIKKLAILATLCIRNIPHRGVAHVFLAIQYYNSSLFYVRLAESSCS